MVASRWYVPKIVDEIIEVVRLIPQQRVQQRTVEQIVHVPEPQVVGRNSGRGPDHSPGTYLESYRRPNRRCASCDATPKCSTLQTVKKTVEVPQMQFFD